jgi:hypothetical protein
MPTLRHTPFDSARRVCAKNLANAYNMHVMMFINYNTIKFAGLGPGPDQEPAGDFYMFDLQCMNWSIVSSATGFLPSARYRHGFTSTFEKVYLFGGLANGAGYEVI